MADAELTPLRRARRARAILAAERVFLDRGFRAATMEAIAAEARISKATLYGYLPDKDAAFRAVAEVMRDRLQDAVHEALERDGPATERITEALIAKHSLVAQTVRKSPHARELFAAKDAAAGQLFAELDAAVVEEMAAALAADTPPRPDPHGTATLLFHASQGVVNAAETAGGLETDLRRLADALLATPGVPTSSE